MTLPRNWTGLLDPLIHRDGPLAGLFFRSVELSYAHPDDVISGDGARLRGGRFARPGTRAVYASVDEETAVREAAAARARLGGRLAIAPKEYPRVIYVIGVRLTRHVDLTTADDSCAPLVDACSETDWAASQEVGEYCREHRCQGIIFRSAVAGCAGRNVVVFRDVAPAPEIVLANRDHIIEQMHRLGERR